MYIRLNTGIQGRQKVVGKLLRPGVFAMSIGLALSSVSVISCGKRLTL
jgi:hypothetical protein